MRRPEHRASGETVGASGSHRPRGVGGGGGGFIFRHASTGRFGRPEGGAKRVERANNRITAARIHQRRLCMKRLRVTPADCLYRCVATVAREGGPLVEQGHGWLVPHISSPEAMPVGRGNPWHSHRPIHWWNKAMDGLFHTYTRIAGSDAGRPWESLAFAPADPLVEQGHGWLVPHIYRQQPPQAGWEPPAGALLPNRRILDH